MVRESVHISDWIQFLESKESLWTSVMLGLAAIFTSAAIGIPILYMSSGDIIFKVSGLIGLLVFWVITGKIIGKIGKEIKKAQKLLDKILRHNFTDVYDIRDEWFKDEKK